MADIFLSYNREDQAMARRFAEALEAQGFTVWWDQTLRSGEAYDQVTEKALRQAKAVVVLWSKTSVESRWVRAEATLADRSKTLVPVMIEPCERPIMFELTQTADLAHWQGDPDDRAWLALLADVRRFVGTLAEPELAVSAPKTSGGAGPAILILPFVNMSGDPEQEYFSDGVTEDIIIDLARVSGLSVVSRHTAFTYKGKTVAAAEIARTLKVGHILEGSVRKSGDRIRITAQLIQASTDQQVWAERFDRRLDDIFAIQDEISQAIVSVLKVKLAPAEKKAIEQRPTASAEAYELFLLARRFGRSGSDRMQPIIDRICKRIVALDPFFARAWALMAFAQRDIRRAGGGDPSTDGGRAAAERAVALDPALAEGHAALGEIVGRGEKPDLAAGLVHAETALRLDPEGYEANLIAGYLYLGLHRYEEAIRHFEKAVALDPISCRAAGMSLQCYAAIGDRDNLQAAARRALARCEAILAIEPDHGGALGFLVNALADLGELGRARETARRAGLLAPNDTRMLYNLACGMARNGDAETALDLLATVVSKVSHGFFNWIDNDSDLDPIRADPRFAALMAKGRARFAAQLSDES